MTRFIEVLRRDLPLRISLTIVTAISLLLVVSLFVMLFLARRAMMNDTLNRASNLLESAMTNIDNILLSVEETTGNTYFSLHLGKPEMMDTYCNKIVESNPYIERCVLAFKPGFYKGQSVWKSDTLQVDDYVSQPWYAETMESKSARWMILGSDSVSDVDDQTISFCLPFFTMSGDDVGVMRADVSLHLLSEIMESIRPTPHTYCALIDSLGRFIVHPMSQNMFGFSAFSIEDESVKTAIAAMTSGNEGHIPFTVNDHDYQLFYKPFVRATVPFRPAMDIRWSLGVAYAEKEIFGAYNSLFYDVLVIAILGMIVLYICTRLVILRWLKPLKMLTAQTERIAQGHYDEPMSAARTSDEIGQLQDNFRLMKQSVSDHISKLNQLDSDIRQQSDELQKAYREAKKGDKMITVFLHNMTDQMIAPVVAINDDVNALCNVGESQESKNIGQLVDNILINGTAIAQLLNSMLKHSEDELEAQKGGEQ